MQTNNRNRRTDRRMGGGTISERMDDVENRLWDAEDTVYRSLKLVQNCLIASLTANGFLLVAILIDHLV